MIKLKKYINSSSWLTELNNEFSKDYFKNLEAFLDIEYSTKKIFPPKENIFSAFNVTSFESVKVVIIGQDPYHGAGQAHGLCFSVLPPTKIPPSLRNIYKEIHRDLNIPIPVNGELTQWAEEGVLLLNSILTVEEAKPMAHQKKGWEQFTTEVIKILNEKKENLVFLAWGAPAIAKVAQVDQARHLVLTSVHPSPLSAHRGFLGCGHFSKCNDYLIKNKIKPVSWLIK